MIESLREPFEEGAITVARAKGSVRFPARSIAVLAMNPCPCGYYGSTVKSCTCRQGDIERYSRKLSGPIVDRVDMWVPVQHIEYETLSNEHRGESTEDIRVRIVKARTFGAQRASEGVMRKLNRELNSAEIDRHVQLSLENRDLMNTLAKKFTLSPRAYHRVLRVARSIADLALSTKVEAAHIMEAFQYRPKNTAVGS